METSDKTARQLYEEIKANPTRPRFGFGRKPAGRLLAEASQPDYKRKPII